MVRHVCLLYGHCHSHYIDQEISRHRLERPKKKMVRRESQGGDRSRISNSSSALSLDSLVYYHKPECG